MSFLPYGSETLSGWVLATGSSVLAHGAVVALTYGGFVQLVAMPPAPTPRPDYTITLERLDADTLAGLLERQDTDVAANPDAGIAGDTLAPDQQQATQAPDSPTAASDPIEVAPPPAAPETTTPDAPPTEVVTPDAIAGDAVTAADRIAPDSIAAVDPVADTLPPVDEAMPAPVPVTPPIAAATSPLIAETVVPINPVAADQIGVTAIPLDRMTAQDAGSFVPVPVPTTVALPVQRVLSADESPTDGTATSPDTAGLNAQTTVAQTTVAPITVALPTVTLPSAARSAAPVSGMPPAPPTAQDLAVGELIARIRATPSDPCLLALPRRDGADGIGLELVAASDAAMAQFATALLTTDDAAIRQTRTLIDPRQCASIAYLRQNRDYPATRLGIALDAAAVPSGGEVSGVLRGIAGRYVLLLIVDNNGVVQDLQRFMSFSGNFARFTVPVTRVGPERDTSQILIAISTDQPAATLRARDGQLAEDVFRDLDEAQGRSAAIGFTTFDVR